MERNEIEAFFCWDCDDDQTTFDPLVIIELKDSRTYIGYIHGWEKSPYEDWIYFQEEDDTSGRIPRNIIKGIRWLHDLIKK